MLQAFNVPAKEKRQRFESCLSIMRQAWAGEPVILDDAGNSVTLDPLPVQRPHPPLWVAAFGPKALAQAGRLGLPYLASPMETMSTLEANYERHNQAVTAAGHAQISIVPVMRTVFVASAGRHATQVRDAFDQPMEIAMRAGQRAWTAARKVNAKHRAVLQPAIQCVQ